jgi:hypothetical protein
MNQAQARKAADKKPLAVCVKHKQGHVVGIPSRLRDYRDPIFDLAPKTVRTVVEIGTLHGWFAWRCLKHLPDAKVYCVDPFFDDPGYGNDGEYNLKCWTQNLKKDLGKRAFLLRGRSQNEAVKWGNVLTPEEIDFLFIDGDHSYEGALADLEGWIPKVRSGGLVAGHDIDGEWGPNVKRALETYCPRNGIDEIHIATVYSFTGKQVTPIWYFYK